MIKRIQDMNVGRWDVGIILEKDDFHISLFKEYLQKNTPYQNVQVFEYCETFSLFKGRHLWRIHGDMPEDKNWNGILFSENSKSFPKKLNSFLKNPDKIKKEVLIQMF